MPKYFSIIFSLLLCYISSDDNVFDRCEGKIASSEIECASNLKDEEKKEGYHCCYFTGKNAIGQNIFQCKFLNNEEYKDLDGTSNNILDEGFTDISIKCPDESISYYLQLSLFYLILILL